ncbi:MAG TPA: LPS export ABC transporter periplasmic protein LptC [Candidatus Deferrimicrobium sp.]|nr:LPS export ABC transporter periplasmic protein LptC [Candidatus Deferrimicrobium sp.]
MRRSNAYFITSMILSVSLLVGCSGKSTTGDRAVATDSVVRPDSEVSGARVYLYERGRVTTEIIADRIVKFTSRDSTMAYRLDIDVFDSVGAVTADIVGDSGIIREATGNMFLYGHVVVVTQDSTRLETEHLIWDSKVDSVKTDAFVRLTRGGDVITGWGLQADQRLRSTKILKQVSGTITDPDKITEP